MANENRTLDVFDTDGEYISNHIIGIHLMPKERECLITTTLDVLGKWDKIVVYGQEYTIIDHSWSQ